MVSDPVKVNLPDSLEVLKTDPERLAKVSDEHQDLLKEKGDWKIFPYTVEMIARGRFALDSDMRVYVDSELATGGYRLPGG
jgi:phosphoribosylglycinamide formyltransferase-1